MSADSLSVQFERIILTFLVFKSKGFLSFTIKHLLLCECKKENFREQLSSSSVLIKYLISVDLDVDLISVDVDVIFIHFVHMFISYDI